jgi:hypothetical protein
MTRWIALPIILTAAVAHAATFPDDASYHPLHCGLAVMTDPLGDDPVALGNLDVVGDVNAAAGLRAGDADFLYLRIRLDRDPAPGGVVAPHAWGMEFDLDGDLSTYELLITVDGIATPNGTVSVYTHHTTTQPDDPADPADLPAAATAMFSDVARTIGAGTTNGGDADSFVDLAIPWTMLAPLGLDRGTRTYVWAGSSSVANALDGDMACHDAGTGGAPRLHLIVSTQTTGDPTLDPNGDGGGTGGGGDGGTAGDGELRLEGGSGCQAGGSLGIGMALALVGLVVPRRLRRRTPRATGPTR